MLIRLRLPFRYSFYFSLFTFPFLLSTFSSAQPPFSVVEATIADMQAAMQQKRVTSRGIVQQYLDRIAKYRGSPERDHHAQSPRARRGRPA